MKRAQSPAPVPTRPAAAVRPTRTFHALASISARRLRGLSLLTSLSLAVVISVLAAFSVLPGWSGPVAVAVLVADFAWLRHAAVAASADRRAKMLGRGSVAAPAGSAARAATRYSDHIAPAVATPVFEAGADVEVAEAAACPAVFDPSAWAPVPVPPPTYTLKAKAETPVRFAAPVAEPATELPSSFDGLVGEGELDELLDRRQA